MSTAKQQAVYNQIIAFYDLAENLLEAVEHNKPRYSEGQFERVESMVLKVERATDLLADAYRNFVKTGRKPGEFVQKRIEKSLQDLYLVVSTVEGAH